MFQVFVDNSIDLNTGPFSSPTTANGCLAYDISPTTLVRDLKLEIEEVEGVPTRRQNLEYDGKILEDDKYLSESSIPDGGLICLVEAHIILEIGRVNGQDENNRFQLLDMQKISLDLYGSAQELCFWTIDVPYVFKDLEDSTGKKVPRECRTSTVEYKDIILDLSPDNIDTPLASYGVRNGDTVRLIYRFESVDSLEPVEKRIIVQASDTLRRRRAAPEAISQTVWYGHGCALYSWDGKMNHPSIKGYGLEEGKIIKNVAFATGGNRDWGVLGRGSDQKYLPLGYIAKISDTDQATIDSLLSNREKGGPPPIPSFHYPKAKDCTFDSPFADQKSSFISVSLDYRKLSTPSETTEVTVKLVVNGTGDRRVSSVSLQIEAPQSEVLEVHPREWVDAQQISTEVNMTETHGSNFGISGLSVDTPVGASVNLGVQGLKNSESQVTLKGTRTSSKTIMGNAIKGNTHAHWEIKDAATAWHGDGLAGSQGEMLKFVLKGKPAAFHYECYITHWNVDNGKKESRRIKSKQSWFSSFLS